MIYTVQKAKLISEQLRRFTSGYAHHVAGHFANSDFWMGEVIGALKAIDEHKARFDQLKNTQERWIANHGTVVYEYCPLCGGKCEFANGTPTPPKRRSVTELNEARRELTDTTYYFLLRCYRMNLLSEEALRQKCELIGTGVELSDLIQ